MLMVPRPRKEFQKMTVGRSENPQNAKSGEYLVLEQEAPLHKRFFSDLEERSNRKSSTPDAVTRRALHLNSSV